jgi:NAD(P)-dependent dehydrogenase (short-subunit alcohol dehydrogenase family)
MSALKGQVAIVTGAASGLGLATAPCNLFGQANQPVSARHVVTAVRLASCRAAVRTISGYATRERASFQICRRRRPAGSAFAMAADWPAQTCIRWTSPSFCPAARIAAVSAR